MNYQLFFSFLTMLDFILAAPIPMPMPVAEPATVTSEATSHATTTIPAAELLVTGGFTNSIQIIPTEAAADVDLDKKDVIITDDYTDTTTTTGDCSTTVTGDAAGQVVVTIAQTVVVDGDGSTLQADTTTQDQTEAVTTATSESVYVTTWANGEVFYSDLPETMVSAVNVAPDTASTGETTSVSSSSTTEVNNTQNVATAAATTAAATTAAATTAAATTAQAATTQAVATTSSSTSSSTQATEQDVTISVTSQTETTSCSTSSTSSSTSSTAPSASASGYLTKVPHSIVYSPYEDDGSCKTYSTVLTDLQLIQSKGINELRVYGNDCNYLTTILKAAKETGLMINQGFWISDAGVDSIDTAVTDLISYVSAGTGGYGWEIFSYFTIGNEAIVSGYCSVSDLISKISEVKGKLQSGGYTGKVTTSEPPVSFEENPTLCTSSEIDFVGINPHSYFDVNSSADEAGTFVAGQIEIVQGICGSLDIVVTETGYPNEGDTNGKNVPSPANQLAAVQAILDNVGVDVTILTTFEDLWKSPGEYNIEQHFGIIQILP